MLHLKHLHESTSDEVSRSFLKKATGQFYTGEIVGVRLASLVASSMHERFAAKSHLRVIDPFGGDGRLIEWLVRSWRGQGYKRVDWDVTVVDVNRDGFQTCKDRISALMREGEDISLSLLARDSFFDLEEDYGRFDAVITNPPWELLKPDRREIERLPMKCRKGYIQKLREYDALLAEKHPLSQPKKKFAGWGTNLSRVGFEVGLKLTAAGGIFGAVLPASMLADEQSGSLRRHVLTTNSLLDVGYFPAEQRHYVGADVDSLTIILEKDGSRKDEVALFRASTSAANCAMSKLRLDLGTLESNDYVLPINVSSSAAQIVLKMARGLSKWRDLEGTGFIWAGREVDETGSANWIASGKPHGLKFVKGRMVERFGIAQLPSAVIEKPGWIPPKSCNFRRIAWRDVSRPNQKRRIIATLIPQGWAAGNSLGVAVVNRGGDVALSALLGVMSSTAFEIQLRSHLATGHISLGALRKVAVPAEETLHDQKLLSTLVGRRLAGDILVEAKIDAYVAKFLYGLSRPDYECILKEFVKFDHAERAAAIEAFDGFTVNAN